jgi:hypothetical protein
MAVGLSAEGSFDCIHNCKFWGYEFECVTEWVSVSFTVPISKQLQLKSKFIFQTIHSHYVLETQITVYAVEHNS